MAQYNRWTSPHLDHDVEAVRDDDILKIEVAELKSMYTCVSTCISYHVFLLFLVHGPHLVFFFLVYLLLPKSCHVGSVRGHKL